MNSNTVPILVPVPLVGPVRAFLEAFEPAKAPRPVLLTSAEAAVALAPLLRLVPASIVRELQPSGSLPSVDLWAGESQRRFVRFPSMWVDRIAVGGSAELAKRVAAADIVRQLDAYPSAERFGESSRVMTLADAADALSVSRVGVMPRLLRRSGIGFRRVGSMYLIDKADLAAFLAARMNEGLAVWNAARGVV